MQTPPPIPEPHENPLGLHQRYVVARKYADGTIAEDPDAEYFVLRLDSNAADKKHIEASRAAAMVYAITLGDHLPELAKELKDRLAHWHELDRRNNDSIST